MARTPPFADTAGAADAAGEAGPPADPGGWAARAPAGVAGVAGREDVHRLDPIDRWGALYQRARLWKRRAHRLAAEAVASGDALAIRPALVRLRRARYWEAVCRDHYLRAVLAEYH